MLGSGQHSDAHSALPGDVETPVLLDDQIGGCAGTGVDISIFEVVASLVSHQIISGPFQPGQHRFPSLPRTTEAEPCQGVLAFQVPASEPGHLDPLLEGMAPPAGGRGVQP